MEIQDTRFWAKVDTGGDHWLWSGAINQDGYGNLTRNGRSERAHRYAWTLATGETLTRHDTICHVCDIPNCVRNDDEGTYRLGANVYPRRGCLYKATQPANVRDRDDKGRGHWATGDEHGTRLHPETVARGTRNANAKLTDEAIRQIRATYTGKHGELTALGRRFNVTPQAIWSVVDGHGWQHVEGTGEAVAVEIRRRDQRGSRHNLAKLTDEQVREIRNRVAAGEVQRRIAPEYGVSVATICNIVGRKTWTDVD